MQQKKIVFLASDCDSSRWVYNALKNEIDFSGVIIEQPVSRKTLFRNRIKRLGLLQVSGQALFSLLVVPVLKKMSAKRLRQIKTDYGFDDAPLPAGVHRVASVNSPDCKALLEQINPDIVLVNGTRIISRNILNCISARFINMHVGITPAYRGSHGGYWALRNNDPENFGTTIHQVDAGVDTGTVLEQAFIKPAAADTFVTYPLLQVAIGIEVLKKVLARTEFRNPTPNANQIKGKVWYQPAIWDYLFHKTR